MTSSMTKMVMMMVVNNYTMREIARLSWNAMDEEQRKLITDVENIKRMVVSKVEDLFVQQYHDTPTDNLHNLVDEFNNTNDLDDCICETIYGLVS